MADIRRVVRRTFGGHGAYWSLEFEGTRRECEKFLERRADAGRNNASSFITKLSVEDWSAMHPATTLARG